MSTITELNDVSGLSIEVEAGVNLYSKAFLAVYDLILHNITTYLAWQCPTREVLAHFREHVGANHLDVGVGTGFFLQRCLAPPERQRVGLLDLNRNCLFKAADAIPDYEAQLYQANVLAPLNYRGLRYDSCSMMHLLHCLPGGIADKAVVFDHLSAMLNPGAVVYGITILQPDDHTNRFGRMIIANSNKKGHFSNLDDSMDGLRAELSRRFVDSGVRRIGQLALFQGRLPG